MTIEPQIFLDTEDVQDIIQQCGAPSLAVYIALQALGNPASIVEIQQFCGMSPEATEEASERLGLHKLGIILEDKTKLRLAR
ncbi:hypothetical protein NZD89_28115 (plasmid) [Alicyclobacillus fastidiosus]|uniref:Uncharacterized protein n=1 Tax=Alicyclobacillus fastidiosus TaxID=392011 RepID=A0ABY6ZSI9_9BACL|nr:hypothetical protein [Alicyclobacillus fastidiosus]WAH44915.1 hypothetical protein NZD89_28115 [Alicyclobacillus fastidiosus]GMA65678.1 hypothetical protein GCM10025859_61180 [Alicyclobacillus fastidiosus]